jgi:hypothetical protein
MLLVAAMAAAIVSLLGTNTMHSVNYMQSQQALFLAESGVQRALLALNKSNWTGWSGTDPKTIQATLSGYGDYDVSVANLTAGTPEITATGYIPSRAASQQAKRVVYTRAVRGNLVGKYSAYGGGSGGGSSIAVSLGGGAYTDSYDASIGRYNVNGNIGQNGDVGTNADITVSGGAHIGGDAITGPAGSFNNQSAVSGSITHDANVILPPVVVPSSLTSLTSSGRINSSTSIASGNYKYNQFTLSSSDTVTITGPANIYLTDNTSIKMTGSSQIVISSASTGPVVIYADGNISAGGQGITNSTYLPSNFQVYGSNSTSQTIKLTGGVEYYGMVYAPHGGLTMSGITNLYGAFFGDTVTMTGGGALHLDQSLTTVTNLPSFVPSSYAPGDWKEIY